MQRPIFAICAIFAILAAFVVVTAQAPVQSGVASPVISQNSQPGQQTWNPGPLTQQTDNLQTTTTDGVIMQNTTAATVGTTVQYSPALKFCGAAWNSSGAASETDCWRIDNEPATVAGTTNAPLTFKASIAGGAYTTAYIFNSTGNFTATGAVVAGAGASIALNGRSKMTSAANGLAELVQSAGTTVSVQFNPGTAAPTINSCSTGTITAHSTNTAGQVTATGATTCSINFGAPAWSFAPFCTMNNQTANRGNISAATTALLTISNLTAGDVVNWTCIGGGI